MNNKRFFGVFIGSFLLLVVAVAGITIYIDPFFIIMPRWNNMPIP